MKSFILLIFVLMLGSASMAQSKQHNKRETGKHAKIVPLPGETHSGKTANGIVSKGEKKQDPLFYKIVDNNKKLAEVTKDVRSANLSGKIVIPPTVKINGVEYKVVNIGENAFDGCTKITSIEIQGNSLQKLCHKCFAGCTGLTYITLNTFCQNLKSDAFVGCTNLKTIKVSSRANNFNFEGCDANVIKY